MGTSQGLSWDLLIEITNIKEVFGNRKNYYRYQAESKINVAERYFKLLSLGYYRG